MNDLMVLLVVLFSPFVAGVISYAFRMGARIVMPGVGISLVLSIYLLTQLGDSISYSWVWIEGLSFSLFIDRTALGLVCVVNLVSLLVLLFSSKYMEADSGKHRYFGFLGFFISSMIGLLMADHLILLFLFWELVGLASYLLIGFWYNKDGIPSSAKMAFMVNRVADACLLAGIVMLFALDLPLDLSSSFQSWPLFPALLITLGAFGKSAQFPFSGWLLKAMVGPTPVSALIHAATMVAAGVYLLIRISDVLPDEVLIFIAITGCTTSLYAAICAVIQHDIKRILAFSTISQLGYMVLGVGVGAASASLFHLITHAFFKAGLFLGAAAIIHFMHQTTAKDGQDMRYMGGLRSKLPWTFKAVLVCGLALAGLPLFSGFLSKDAILIASWHFALELGSSAYLIAELAIFTALLTAFYVGRMVLLIFFGTARTDYEVKPAREYKRFYFPLITLALLSTWIFFTLNPFGHSSWVLQTMGYNSSAYKGDLIPFLSVLMVLTGLTLAYSFFKPNTKYSKEYQGIHNPTSRAGLLVFNGLYLESIYARLGDAVGWLAHAMKNIDLRVVDSLLHFVAITSVVGSKILALFDRFVIDGPVNFVAHLSSYLGKRFAGLSSRDGQIQLIWLILIVILILLGIVFF